MSTVETWTHPKYAKTSAWHMKEVSILNNKLLAVGLIDYTGNNDAQITEIGEINLGVTSNLEFYPMGDLYYKLPIGDDSIEVENVIGESYKNIVRESYSSTEAYIRIRVGMSSIYKTASKLALSSDKHYRFGFSCCFSNKPQFSDNELYIGMYARDATAGGQSLLTSTVNSVVTLTGDTLNISFLHVGSNVVGNQPTTYYNPHHLIQFTLYRNDGEITVFHPTYEHDISNLSESSSDSYFMKPRLLVIDRHSNQTLVTKQTTFIQNGVTNYIPLDSTGKKYFRYTYCGLYTGIKINPSVLKGVATSETVVNKVMNYSNVIMNYRGHKVKMKYFDYGEFWMPFRWSALNNSDDPYKYTTFSYYILINNHPCTTNSVGNP